MFQYININDSTSVTLSFFTHGQRTLSAHGAVRRKIKCMLAYIKYMCVLYSPTLQHA